MLTDQPHRSGKITMKYLRDSQNERVYLHENGHDSEVMQNYEKVYWLLLSMSGMFVFLFLLSLNLCMG